MLYMICNLVIMAIFEFTQYIQTILIESAKTSNLSKQNRLELNIINALFANLIVSN